MVKLERNIIYSFPIISILCEIIKSFLGDETKIIAIRNYGFFLIMIYLLLKYAKRTLPLNVFLVLLMIYLTIQLIATGGKLEQYNDLVRAMDGKLLLPIGFVLTSTYDHLKLLNKRLFITNILFVVSIVIFSILGIGENQYGGDSGFNVGTFTFSAIYTGSFLLIVLPLTYVDFKNKLMKNAVPVLGIATMIILILSVRRTAIVFVVIGAAVYMYLYRSQLSKFALNAIAVLIVMVLTYPLYEGILMKQIEARSDVFNEEGVAENLQEETRLVETLAVYRERIMSPNISILLFGQHLFDSPGNYDYGIHKERPLHLDLNIMLHGAGLVGLVLLILFYGTIAYKYVRLKVKLHVQHERLIIGAFLGIYFSHLFLLFSGGMLTITFNLISYLYMGAILGLFYSSRKERMKPPMYVDDLSEDMKEGGGFKKNSKPFIYETYKKD